MKNKTKTKINRPLSALILIVSALIFLASCSMIDGYSEPEDQLIVSAIGFDVEGEGVRVSLSISRSEENEGDELLSGVGKTIPDALGSIASAEDKTLDGAHLTVIVLGEGIDGEWLSSIVNFCKKNVDVSVSARLVSSSNAHDLLESFSGYKLGGVLRDGRGAPISSESRLYSVASAINDGTFALPHFTRSNEGFELYGARIYSDGSALLLLNFDESALYMMMRGKYTRGKGAADFLGDAAPELIKTEYSYDDSTLTVSCVVDRNADGIKNQMDELYRELSTRYGDIFGFTERARKMGFSGEGFEELTVKLVCEERG